ncbi:hypothetical protein ACFOW1_05360 [Parasediminibacterium paludis]|uniref:Uncharacterized protein n=1 Tax=Parasediminibacterium paludis TaxID=908966 RepID=A0ABV8PWJ5_9BACT
MGDKLANANLFLEILFATIILGKTLLYYRLRNPDGDLVQSFISGELGFYVMLAFLPILPSNYPQRKRFVKGLNYLTLALYFTIIVLFVIAPISSNNK